MRYSLDTSAVVKRYAPERGSRWIKSLIENHENSVTIVQICIVEVAAALAKKVRTAEIGRDDCQQAQPPLGAIVNESSSQMYRIVATQRMTLG